eukprot:gnl/Trimastix_PCT/859.p2 GENE.gnl/Trimastix_PCT/859~~gnl/Trimastix_PCT/859.p2  ORF type:complete len:169 (+),score=65.55 gnl/Trimastix_PCT/859:69-509(+)
MEEHYFMKVLCSVVCILYPAYASFKAVKSTETDDDTQWLTYWAVFGFFSFFETLLYFIIEYIPFYFLLKLVFFLWMQLPFFQGALRVFDWISKYLESQRDTIAGMERTMGNFVTQAEARGATVLGQATVAAMQQQQKPQQQQPAAQ